MYKINSIHSVFNNTQNVNNDNEASQILKIWRLNITLLQKN